MNRSQLEGLFCSTDYTGITNIVRALQFFRCSCGTWHLGLPNVNITTNEQPLITVAPPQPSPNDVQAPEAPTADNETTPPTAPVDSLSVQTLYRNAAGINYDSTMLVTENPHSNNSLPELPSVSQGNGYRYSSVVIRRNTPKSLRNLNLHLSAIRKTKSHDSAMIRRSKIYYRYLRNS